MVDWSLYLVTDPHLGGGREQVADIVACAIDGGVTVVQLRDKTATDDQFRRATEDILTVSGDVPVFVNDRVDIAVEFGTHVHIGQDDMDYERATSLLRDGQMIGLSIGNQQELQVAVSRDRPPDVVGIGPVLNTTTKPDAPAGIGVHNLVELASSARFAGIASVAIGGISADLGPVLRTTDVDGLCVVSAIMAAEDPTVAAQQLRSSFR